MSKKERRDLVHGTTSYVYFVSIILKKRCSPIGPALIFNAILVILTLCTEIRTEAAFCNFERERVCS